MARQTDSGKQRREKPRISVDTSIFVSALRSRHAGISFKCLEYVADRFTVVQSRDTLEEINKMVASPGSSAERGQDWLARQSFLGNMKKRFEILAPPPSPMKCRDPNDQMFVDLAHGASCVALLTLDYDLLDMVKIGPSLVMQPGHFYQIFAFGNASISDVRKRVCRWHEQNERELEYRRRTGRSDPGYPRHLFNQIAAAQNTQDRNNSPPRPVEQKLVIQPNPSLRIASAPIAQAPSEKFEKNRRRGKRETRKPPIFGEKARALLLGRT